MEEFGKVIARGGSAIIISSQSGHRLGALSQEENEKLAFIDGGTTASYWYGDLSYMRNTMGK